MSNLSLPFPGPPSKNGKFGARTITLHGKKVVHLHDGTDWPTAYETPLRAMGDGVISFKTYTKTRGHQVGVRHPDGSESGFNLCREASPLPLGRPVKKGDIIARSGPHPGWEKTGAAATGAHSHAWLKFPKVGFVDMMARLKYTLDSPAVELSTPFDAPEDLETIMALKDTFTIYSADERGHLVLGPGFSREIIGNERLETLGENGPVGIVGKRVTTREWDVIAEFFRGNDELKGQASTSQIEQVVKAALGKAGTSSDVTVAEIVDGVRALFTKAGS